LKAYARGLLILAIFAAAINVRDVNAQSAVEAEAARHQVDTSIRYLPSRSFKAQPGKIAIVESDFEYSYTHTFFDKLSVEFSLNSGYIGLGASGTGEVPLPSRLTALGAGIETTLPFFNLEKTYWRVQLMPSYNTDDWSARASAFRMPVHTFIIYQPNAVWTFVGGVAVYNDFQERVFPILGFIYKPNDRLTFNIVPDDPHIAYALNDYVTVFAGGGITSSEFEVRKDSLRDVVMRYSNTHVGAGVTFKLNKHIEASVSSGYLFNRCLKYGDSRGKFNIKNDVYSEARIEIGI